MDRRQHWDTVYTTKGDDQVSWFEPAPEVSLRLIEEAGLAPESCVIDIGGGESRLVDALLARGVRCVTVLDVSQAAIDRVCVRLGAAASGVTWIVADVTGPWISVPVDVWHDRAVFHFLTDPEDRIRYVQHLTRTLKVGGTAIIATFAPDGPERCSGLPVVRYSPEALADELGSAFTLVHSEGHSHRTPSGALQAFHYSRFMHRPSIISRTGAAS